MIFFLDNPLAVFSKGIFYLQSTDLLFDKFKINTCKSDKEIRRVQRTGYAKYQISALLECEKSNTWYLQYVCLKICMTPHVLKKKKTKTKQKNPKTFVC